MNPLRNPLNKKEPNYPEYCAGENAFSNGLALDDNPYRDTNSELASLWESGWNHAFKARQEFEDPKPSKVISCLMKLKRVWGMMFRFLFIVSIGFIGWHWIDPQSIGDIPFSELTLNHILKNLFALLLIIGCIAWFFHFPDRHEEMKDDPYSKFPTTYNMWANFSGALIVIGLLIWGWLKK